MNLVRNIKQASLLAGILSASLLISNNPATADQTACVIIKQGATVCGRLTSLKPPSNNPQPTSSNQVQIDKFTVTLKGCKRNERTVKCTFEIVNIGKEEKGIRSGSGASYIIDSTGTSYPTILLDMGGRTFGNNSIGEATVVPGIESFASINIMNVPLEVTQAKVLGFDTSLSKKVQFRNVPISD